MRKIFRNFLKYLLELTYKDKPFVSRHAPQKDWVTVFCDDRGQHLIMMPNTQVLKQLTKTIVTDEQGSFPYAKFESFVNIAKDEKQAISYYE